jgi:hypothetical protein
MIGAQLTLDRHKPAGAAGQALPQALQRKSNFLQARLKYFYQNHAGHHVLLN